MQMSVLTDFNAAMQEKAIRAITSPYSTRSWPSSRARKFSNRCIELYILPCIATSSSSGIQIHLIFFERPKILVIKRSIESSNLTVRSGSLPERVRTQHELSVTLTCQRPLGSADSGSSVRCRKNSRYSSRVPDRSSRPLFRTVPADATPATESSIRRRFKKRRLPGIFIGAGINWIPEPLW